ncbi:MAG: DUF3429 domain-containing protein [Pseudomonadota bacterium]
MALHTVLMSLGVIPFLVPVLFVLFPNYSPIASVMMLFIIQAYGVVILSFLSGIQWGLSLQKNKPAFYTHYILPLWSNIIALAAFFAMLQHSDITTLIILIFGFISQLVADMHFTRAGFYTRSYLGKRMIISLIVIIALIAVLHKIS